MMLTVSAVVIAAIAITAVPYDALHAAAPEGWTSPFFGWELDLDWTGIISEVNQKISEDQFSLFTIFFMMMVFKGETGELLFADNFKDFREFDRARVDPRR